jgi:hypothetical protein
MLISWFEAKGLHCDLAPINLSVDGRVEEEVGSCEICEEVS